MAAAVYLQLALKLASADARKSQFCWGFCEVGPPAVKADDPVNTLLFAYRFDYSLIHSPRALDPICMIQRRNNGGPPPVDLLLFLVLWPDDLGPFPPKSRHSVETAAWREVSSFAEAAKNRHGRAVSGAINIPMARGGSLRCGRPQ